MRETDQILLISCYELGRQPLGLGGPLAVLRRAGYRPTPVDISVEAIQEETFRRAEFVGISVPMHTALRLGVRVAERVRELNPRAHVCFYGLYAGMNRDYLLEHRLADSCIGGEAEGDLLRLVRTLDRGREPSILTGVATAPGTPSSEAKRPDFLQADRSELPGLDRYAHLVHQGEARLAGAVETTRGCKHLCSHCPLPPVYDGRFFAIPEEVVQADIDYLVEAGAEHITFADPDFLNGPRHAVRIAEALHDRHPDVTFDFTAKVEHLVRHRDLLPRLGRAGCLFCISAVESFNDEILEILKKGHTRADVLLAQEALDRAGIALRPTFVAFTPWTSAEDYLDFFRIVENRGLIDAVEPVQYTVRLLLPPGSHLLEHPAMKPHLETLDEGNFSWRWSHPDSRLDDLHREVAAFVEEATSEGRDGGEIFYELWERARRRLDGSREPVGAAAGSLEPERARPPRMTEDWFC